MTNTTVNGTTQPFNPVPIGDVRPPRILAARPTPTLVTEGKVACFRGNGPVLTYRISADMWRAFRALQPEDSHVEVEFLGDNSWKLTPNRAARARFHKDSAAYILQVNQPATFEKLGHFYSTPAEYMLVDGSMLVTLKEAPRATPTAPAIVKAAKVRRLPKAPLEKCMEWKQQIERGEEPNTQGALLDVAAVTSNPELRMEALLEALRTVERTTAYRLKKDKETGAWVFCAPIIR